MRPGTVHATYLVYGSKKVERGQEDGDVDMTSSAPDGEPLSEEVQTFTMTLVQEAQLQGMTQALPYSHLYCC
jgi:DNA polymerase delta subunit 3